MPTIMLTDLSKMKRAEILAVISDILYGHDAVEHTFDERWITLQRMVDELMDREAAAIVKESQLEHHAAVHEIDQLLKS